MLVYAASAFLLNHGPRMNELLGVTPPNWEVVHESEFSPDDTFPRVREEQARAILSHLDLDGPHRLPGKPDPNQMVIVRICGSGHYRITWQREQSELVVQQQKPFSFYRLIHFLHFKHGYNQSYVSHFLWAVVVDAVAISIVLWVVSGIYIWARRPRRRWLGGVCMIAGSIVFIFLAVLLCR
jgi:hypothetical protein